MKTIRVFTIVAFFCIGIQTSQAQDVHVFLAADHVRTFTQPYLSPSGGTFGFRFPVKRVAVELALTHARASTGFYLDKERRSAGTLSILYVFRSSENWVFEAGVEAGYGTRYIYRAGDVDFSMDQEFISYGAVASIRYMRGEWVQPFLSIRPTYDQLIQGSQRHSELYSTGPLLMIIRAGFSFALPSEKERRSGW